MIRGHLFGSFFAVYPIIGNDFATASEKQSFSAKYFLFIKVETSQAMIMFLMTYKKIGTKIFYLSSLTLSPDFFTLVGLGMVP